MGELKVMSDIYKPVDWNVQHLVGQIKSGSLRLPDLQRPFVWPATKVRDLLDSMYKGYPVGELMFWNQPEAVDSHSIGKLVKSHSSSHLIVDGQQRLTSLFVAFTGEKVVDDDYQEKKIKICFNPLLERFEVAQPIYEKSAEWIPDVSTVFNSALQAHKAYVFRWQEAKGEPLDEESSDKVFHALNELDSLRYRIFKVVELQNTIDKAVVADIFVRINSEGMNLKVSDYILTWLSVFWPDGRDQLEAFARNSRMTPERIAEVTGAPCSWSPRNYYIAPTPGLLIRAAVGLGQKRGKLQDAYKALLAKDRKTGQTDPAKQQEELAKIQAAVPQILNSLNWDEFIRVLNRAGFRSKRMITSNAALMYAYTFWLMGRHEFGVDLTVLRDLMARWFFMVQTSARYAASSETRYQADLDRFDGVTNAAEFVAVIEQMIEPTFSADFWTVRLPDALITSSAESPAYLGYLAALNILDAELFALPDGKVRDWTDPANSSIKEVERHHLFPANYLREVTGLSDRKRINQVANYAPTDWSTNIFISDKSPAEYWPGLVETRGISGHVFEKQAYFHALPPAWEKLNYSEFLLKRRQLMSEVVRDAFLRLSDPTYQPAAMNNSSAQMATKMPPGLSLLDLVSAGILATGTKLFSAPTDDDVIAEVSEDGEIIFDETTFDTPDRAAHAAGSENADGWEFWTVETDEGPVSLKEIRANYLASL
jgi:hypothetical protein